MSASPACRSPRGVVPGDRVIAERSHWLVLRVDLGRREAICQLCGGAGVLRRFRAHAIRLVMTPPAEAGGPIRGDLAELPDGVVRRARKIGQQDDDLRRVVTDGG